MAAIYLDILKLKLVNNQYYCIKEKVNNFLWSIKQVLSIFLNTSLLLFHFYLYQKNYYN